MLDFKPGQKVVYPNYGVTVVEKIDAASWDGLQQRSYHLRLLSNNAQIMVPLINKELVGLRPLGGNGEIRSLFGILGAGHMDAYKAWKGRDKQTLDKMRPGRLIEVADVLKNLRLVSERKSLSFREKKMFERAKHFIVSEVAHVRAIAEPDALGLVEGALASSLAKRHKKEPRAC